MAFDGLQEECHRVSAVPVFPQGPSSIFVLKLKYRMDAGSRLLPFRVDRRCMAAGLASCSVRYRTHPPTLFSVLIDLKKRPTAWSSELMARQTNAPKFVTWIISLVLFIVAIVAHFGLIQVSPDIATWSWIIGYALLLAAVQLKGL
jgi:hypothetical protein